MKKVRKIIEIIQIPLKLVLLGFLALVSYECLNKIFVNEEVSHGESFHSLPKNSMDVIVLGSSHAQYSFVPTFFYQDTGLYAYVLGSACQPLEVSYQMLREALKTQSPKLVVLEVFTSMPLRSGCEDDSCYVIAEYQMTGAEKYNTINYLPAEKAAEYRNDFLNYHNNWRNMDFATMQEKQKKAENSYEMIDPALGYVFAYGIDEYPANWWHASHYDEDIDVSLDELDSESLQNIYDLCQENNIELLLYKTPIDGIDEENQSYLHEVWKWADAQDIPYLDLITKQDELDFYMWIHSNSYHCFISGSGLITGYLADYITHNYDFNHQEDIQLSEVYRDYGEQYTYQYLNYEYDPAKYIRRFAYGDGYVLLRYNPAQERLNAVVEAYLLSMGAAADFTAHNYVAVFKDGKLLEDSYDVLDLVLDGHQVHLDAYNICVDGVYYNQYCPLSICYGGRDLSFIYPKYIEYRQWLWDYGKRPYSR